MVMDLTGIKNQNEYYTTHYFTSIFQENAEDTITGWKNRRKDDGVELPWALFRNTSTQYYRVRDRYLHTRNEEASKPYIQEMANLYLDALGFRGRKSVDASVGDNLIVPVFHEETRSNGAPLLWAFLCVAQERDEDILESIIFAKSEDEEANGVSVELKNDDILAKLFFAGDEAPRFILLIGINQIALIDRNKWSEKRFLQFNLDDIFSRHEESTFMALTVLLHKESLCPVDGVCVLDGLDENSHKHSAGVSDALKFALRESIEILGNEVIYDMKTRQGIDLETNPIDAGELTLECLRYMYRFLFMLFIEARPELGYAPMKTQAYVQGYSLEGIRDVCDRVDQLTKESETVAQGYYIDDTISELFRMIYEGYPGDLDEYKKALAEESLHDVFTIEALKAHIFDPEYTKHITNARLRNCAMLQIVDLMSISRATGKTRAGRISYSALGINQMGAVYEALLSYRGFIAEETLFEVKRAGDKFNELDVGYFIPEGELVNYTEDERVRYEKGPHKGELRKYEQGTFIYRLAGREREKSASYYTPEVLTKCLVKYALKELLKDKTADEILNLTICEPAMGSAAFLNESINQLAEAYLNKKQEELGETIPYDERFNKLQEVKMFIADRNVYGCDLNPIAVELAEVSLWLNTIYKGAYVPWFGTQLVNGNSLIGARRQVYYTSKLEKGKWYEEAPDRVMPGEKRKRTGVTSRVYHFLLGDPGMANYTDKVIKSLEPDNLKKIKDWQKAFTKKYDEDDIKTLLRLSDIIDTLWDRTVELRKRVERATSEPLSVYGHDESQKEGSHKTIREKDEIYHRLFKSEHMNNAGPYARLKAAMDYWCALWFWPIDKADLLPSRQEFFFEMSLILEGGIQAVNTNSSGQMRFGMSETGELEYFVEGEQLALEFRAQYDDLGVVCLDDLRSRSERLAIANRIAEAQKFHHWELEFADVFEDKGGFDLFVGNPPWVTTSWMEKDFLSDFYPNIQVHGFSSAEIDQSRNDYLKKDEIRCQYLNGACESFGASSFFDAKLNYPLLNGVQKDLYKCFFEMMLSITNKSTVLGFIHPEEIYNDSTDGAEIIRKQIYEKLVYHFQFRNELNLFKDVGHAKIFTISIMNCIKNEIGFCSINNLFEPAAVDECFSDDGKLEGIKNENNQWSTRGHKLRCNFFNQESLKNFVNIFESNSMNPLYAKLPTIHTRSMYEILMRFGEQNKTVESITKIVASEMYHETNSVKAGIIKKEEHIPQSPFTCVLAGPNIGECTMYAKIPRINCSSKGDYDVFNLEKLTDSPAYLPRVLFNTAVSEEKILEASSDVDWGGYHIEQYRLALKTMLSNSSEFNLKPCIIPPKVGHIQSIITFSFEKEWMLLYVCGLLASLPYLFFFKITGKKKFSRNTINMFPIVGKDEFTDRILHRVLLLNCSSNYYAEIWNHNIKNYRDDSWLDSDLHLRDECFEKLSMEWNRHNVNLSDYERHQLFIEIDVLVCKQLGITVDELAEIYSTYFPNYKQSEENTYYDAHGRIVYTSNRTYSSSYNFSTSDWEKTDKYKNASLMYCDTYLGKEEECAIEFQYPYISVDRVEVYRRIWNRV